MSAIAAGQTAARIDVAPRAALVDESVAIRISGLAPDSGVMLRASATDALGRLWRSETAVRADGSGSVDFSAAKSAELAMQPFWSMTMAPEVPSARRVPAGFARPERGGYDVLLEAVVDGKAVASATARRLVTAKDVVLTEVRQSGLIGRLYEPAGNRRHPAVLVLTGSNGGIPAQHAGLLAARGYVAFALAYFRMEGLPQDLVELPLEYFEGAVAWLKKRPTVDPARVGVTGISKGAELSLLLPALHPEMFRAIVAISPSSEVWEGGVRDPSAKAIAAIRPGRSSWSARGEPLPFLAKKVTAEIRQRIEKEGAVDTIEFYQPALDDAAAVSKARIPVENIRAAALLVSSRADRMWPSATMAAQVCNAMQARRLRCEHVEYPDAAHMITEPWLPVAYGTYPAAPGRWDRPSLGGSAAGSAHAAADSWPRILRFLDRELQPQSK